MTKKNTIVLLSPSRTHWTSNKYLMFDPFQQSKLMNGFDRLKSVPTPTREDSLEDIRRLAGIGQTSMGEEMSQHGTNLGAIQREKNIQPGTDEWFRLWFAKPKLTGETPYDK